jgi:tripartite-type tricarboxylate transporter receptor subunit TctC
MGSAGVASVGHLAGELFNVLAGVKLVHVPYRGNGPALTALLGGQVEALFASIPSAAEFVKSGKLRALGVTGAGRSAALPEVPPIGNVVPDYEVSAWFGAVAPKGTPTTVIDTLNREINAGLADDKMKVRFADLGATEIAGSPADFGKFIAAETEKWAKVIGTAGLKAD